jgi:hypothetical protein
MPVLQNDCNPRTPSRTSHFCVYANYNRNMSYSSSHATQPTVGGDDISLPPAREYHIHRSLSFDLVFTPPRGSQALEDALNSAFPLITDREGRYRAAMDDFWAKEDSQKVDLPAQFLLSAPRTDVELNDSASQDLADTASQTRPVVRQSSLGLNRHAGRSHNRARRQGPLSPRTRSRTRLVRGHVCEEHRKSKTKVSNVTVLYHNLYFFFPS